MRRAVLEGNAVFISEFMKHQISSLSLIVIFLLTALSPVNAQVNVTQKNNNLSRDGLYIDPRSRRERSESDSRP